MYNLFAAAQGGLAVFALIFLTFLLVVGGFLFVIEIFFLLTLSRALGRCRPMNRTMSPGQVWLMFLPFFNMVWQFFVVLRVPESIQKEFLYRGRKRGTTSAGKVGLIMCVSSLFIWIPWLGLVSIPYLATALAVVYLVCWVVFWVKIAGFSDELARGDIEYDEEDNREDSGDRRSIEPLGDVDDFTEADRSRP